MTTIEEFCEAMEGPWETFSPRVIAAEECVQKLARERDDAIALLRLLTAYSHTTLPNDILKRAAVFLERYRYVPEPQEQASASPAATR